MKRFFQVAASSVGLLANVLISSLGYSQVSDTSGILLDEVVFTANKFPNKSSLTGKVVLIIDRDQLEKSGGRDLSQLLNEQAGIYVAGSNSNAGKDKSIFLRGAGIQHTLIAIDGIPVYDASGIGSNFDIRNISIDNIERIEIVKGSQSTLYGSDAIAGVINIITHKPKNNLFNAYGLTSYGSNQTSKLQAGLSSKKKAFDFDLNYSYLNTAGINEANDTIGQVDKDGSWQHSFSASSGWQPHKQVRLQPFFRFNDIHGDLDQAAYRDDRDYTFHEKNYQAGIRSEFIMGKNRLNLIYHFNDLAREYVNDSMHVRAGAFDSYSRGSYQAAEHFLDIYTHAALTEKMKLVAGADFRHAVSDQEYRSLSLFGEYNTKNSRDSLKHSHIGIYANINYTPGEIFSVEAGNRLNFHSVYGTVDVFNLNPSLLINNQLKLFTNFSTGFRTPSLYQLFSEFGNSELKPERARTWEGGIQVFSKQKRFMARAVFFTRTIRDLVFFYTDPSTFQSKYINQDEQKDHGIELESSYRFDKVSIRAFYSFVDGKITTRQNSRDTSFFNLNRRPKNSLAVNIGFQLTQAFYASSNLSVFGDRKDAYFDDMLFTNVNVTLESYALWDIYLQYAVARDRVKIFADLRNITNSRYQEVAGFNTLGRTITGGLRVDLSQGKKAK